MPTAPPVSLDRALSAEPTLLAERSAVGWQTYRDAAATDPDIAADTAWAIASPETHHQLVRQAGYGYDELEGWVRTTLSAALFPDQ